MSKEKITPEVSARICAHMNHDHTDSLVSLAHRYLNISVVTEVKMVELNSDSMKLEINEEIKEILFDHRLVDSSDAHRTLVEMVNKTTKGNHP